MTVIGVKWVGNASSPTLTRIGHDGTNSTYTGPASGGTLFNSFGTWGEMRRVNLWDDGTVTSSWGTRCYTDSYVNDLGQVMVQIPAFLCWIDRSGAGSGDARFWVGLPSDIGTVVDTYGLAPAHTFSETDTHPLFIVDGNYVDYAYISAFEGYINNDMVLESVAGVTPSTIDTQTDARTYAESRGTGWELMTIQATSALQVLYMVEYATLNSQSAIGNGITSAGGIANTGATGSTGTDRGNLTYGTTGNSTTAMSYRGVENLWGNISCAVEGLNVNASRVPWIAPQSRTRPTYYQWSTFSSPYVTQTSAIFNSGAGSYIESLMPYQSKSCVSAFLGYTGGGTSSTYFCDDAWLPTTGNLVMMQGGRYNDAAGAGIFAQRFNVIDTISTGGRLQYLPSAE